MRTIITTEWLKAQNACFPAVCVFRKQYPSGRVGLRRLINDIWESPHRDHITKWDWTNWIFDRLFPDPLYDYWSGIYDYLLNKTEVLNCVDRYLNGEQ